jgi:hypothetical protein
MPWGSQTAGGDDPVAGGNRRVVSLSRCWSRPRCWSRGRCWPRRRSRSRCRPRCRSRGRSCGGCRCRCRGRSSRCRGCCGPWWKQAMASFTFPLVCKALPRLLWALASLGSRSRAFWKQSVTASSPAVWEGAAPSLCRRGPPFPGGEAISTGAG